ncbi:hypothetical protein C1N70_13560 [Cytobacillus firmus]
MDILIKFIKFILKLSPENREGALGMIGCFGLALVSCFVLTVACMLVSFPLMIFLDFDVAYGIGSAIVIFGGLGYHCYRGYKNGFYD